MGLALQSISDQIPVPCQWHHLIPVVRVDLPGGGKGHTFLLVGQSPHSSMIGQLPKQSHRAGKITFAATITSNLFTDFVPTNEPHHHLCVAAFRLFANRNPPISIKMSTAELATSYAALILADDGVEITVRHSLSHSSRSTLRNETNPLTCFSFLPGR